MLGNLLGLLSLAVSLVNILIYIGRIKAVRVPLRPIGHVSFMLLAIILFIAALFAGADILGVIAGSTAFIMAGFFLVMVSFSGLPHKEIVVNVGDPLPTFRTVDADGRPFSIDSLRGTPFVLIFFRGWWCVYCVAKLGRFEHLRPRFEQLGLALVSISPDTPSDALGMKSRRKLGMLMLSDESLSVTDLFNLRHENAPAGGGRGLFRDLAIPSTVLVDADGIVRWVYQSVDYRVRSNPGEELAVAGRPRPSLALT